MFTSLHYVSFILLLCAFWFILMFTIELLQQHQLELQLTRIVLVAGIFVFSSTITATPYRNAFIKCNDQQYSLVHAAKCECWVCNIHISAFDLLECELTECHICWWDVKVRMFDLVVQNTSHQFSLNSLNSLPLSLVKNAKNDYGVSDCDDYPLWDLCELIEGDYE